MPHTPPVSIVVTSYNYDRFVGEAIESALAQTYRHTEVIVVDDGSQDRSREVVAGFGGRVRPIYKANGGQASAWNAGFRESTGGVVIFLDSDDVLLPTAAETAAARLSEPGVVKAHWRMWEVDADGRRTGRANPRAGAELATGDCRQTLVERGTNWLGWPPTSGNAFSRACLERLLPMPEREYVTCPDFYLCELAPLLGSIARIDEPQSLYRWHGSNNMGGVMNDRRAGMVAHVRRRLAELCRDMGIPVRPEAWHSWYDDWLEKVTSISAKIETLIPPPAPYLFADDDQLRSEFVAGRRAMPFPQRDGVYWGPPPDDASAIRELEGARAAGVGHLVLAWPTFWWLDHYVGFVAHLRAAYPCVMRDDELVVFDLLTAASPTPTREGQTARPGGTARD